MLSDEVALLMKTENDLDNMDDGPSDIELSKLEVDDVDSIIQSEIISAASTPAPSIARTPDTPVGSQRALPAVRSALFTGEDSARVQNEETVDVASATEEVTLSHQGATVEAAPDTTVEEEAAVPTNAGE